MKRNYKIVVPVAIVLMILLSLGGYKIHHQLYLNRNAFYFSYKNHESMAKQQDAFFKSVKPADLKRIHVDYGLADRSQDIQYLYLDKKEYYISLSPRSYHMDLGNNNALLVNAISNVERNYGKDSLCSFYFNNDFTKVSTVSGLDRKNVENYKKEALSFYKDTFRKVYENWELK